MVYILQFKKEEAYRHVFSYIDRDNPCWLRFVVQDSSQLLTKEGFPILFHSQMLEYKYFYKTSIYYS